MIAPITCDVLIEDQRWSGLDLEVLSARIAAALGDALKLPGGHEVVLLACDDTRIAALNADFRGKPRPTNVLSWPEAERGAPVDGQAPRPVVPDEPLGDIALAYETCMAEARDQGKTAVAHVTHLVLHGLLHLLGYDHERDGDATLMESLEVAILGNLGIADPYC